MTYYWESLSCTTPLVGHHWLCVVCFSLMNMIDQKQALVVCSAKTNNVNFVASFLNLSVLKSNRFGVHKRFTDSRLRGCYIVWSGTGLPAFRILLAPSSSLPDSPGNPSTWTACNCEISPTRCNNCVLFFAMALLYMFRATISPIIRSTYAVYGHR